MTNTKLLNEKIAESGRSKQWLAEKLGLSYHGLAKKINNITEFKALEIKHLCELLDITDYEERELIFFNENVDN